jgi:Rad3-related DNA helicase
MTSLIKAGARSIILASGTLAPLQSFAADMEMWAQSFAVSITLFYFCSYGSLLLAPLDRFKIVSRIRT